jgi:short-subunit dehydrogenase
MIARGGGGHLLFVSSMAGLVNVPGYAAYCSSKHALTSFARCIRPELRGHGIRVSLIHPYKVDTPFFDE